MREGDVKQHIGNGALHPKPLDAELNAFASRCFRDVADMDYINARLCNRAGMAMQFHWAAMQAMEKYYKAILLYNRIEATDVNHNLAKTQQYSRKLPFELHLSDETQHLIEYLNQCGPDRYLSVSYNLHGDKLSSLDRAVWEIRRYCKILNYTLSTQHGDVPMLVKELGRIETAEDLPPHKFRLPGGRLEEIVRKKNHPAREALIWHNRYYGLASRATTNPPKWSRSENSPILMYPGLLEEVIKYIKVPVPVIKAYRAYFARKPEEAGADNLSG